ncbi:MAG TPA: sugar phosphate isomerase/epimerase [Methanofastidiosum sp.]|nr:sugar phosphate isomerase/epimerase [Methanofastidiosum sp.]HPC80744.1 sugar phosphate isomerase/epimerase [Methanofastidiosum sp.]HRS26306.1 sugar phosphate isomerase/epimerase [Methanofastidiosum sp.]
MYKKLGFSSLAFYEVPLENALIWGEDAKFNLLEIVAENNHAIDEETMPKVKDILSSYSFEYTVHSPFSDINISSLNKSIRKVSIQQVKYAIYAVNEIGGKVMTFHPGRHSAATNRDKELTKKILFDSLKEISTYNEDYGVVIALENMPDTFVTTMKVSQEILEVLENKQLPGIKHTMDVGHLETNNVDIERYIQDLKDFLVHIHLHDNLGEFDNHLPLGEGNIDFSKVFMALKKINYSGRMILEMTNTEDILKSREFLRERKYLI